MNRNYRIAIVSDEWLVSFGLKSVILEIAPLCRIELFADPESYTQAAKEQRYDFVFSFVSFPDLNTEVINRQESSSNIRTLLHQLLSEGIRPETGSSVLRQPLTKRETEVLRLLTQGLLNKEIADKLGISLHTAISHRKNIISKLGIKTVSGLTIYAMMHGVI